MAELRQSQTLRRLEEELVRLRAQQQFRHLPIPTGIPFSSNDYLGLSLDPRLKHAIVRAVEDDERVASTGSRLLSGNCNAGSSSNRNLRILPEPKPRFIFQAAMLPMSVC